jgi:hypothetical protein
MVRRPPKTEGTEGVEERKKDSSTQVEGGRIEEKHRKHQLLIFGVWNALCELSIYRENSQLIIEKLWEQVIHYFDVK